MQMNGKDWVHQMSRVGFSRTAESEMTEKTILCSVWDDGWCFLNLGKFAVDIFSAPSRLYFRTKKLSVKCTSIEILGYTHHKRGISILKEVLLLGKCLSETIHILQHESLEAPFFCSFIQIVTESRKWRC